MSNENSTIIEINGVKLEVDLRTAKRVEELRVGSKVKVLKKGYGNDYKVHAGVVVGFEPFENLPTIVVCYLDVDYSSAKLEFAHFNAKSNREDLDIVAAIDDDLPCRKADVLDRIDAEIERKRKEIEDVEAKRAFFLKHFEQYFEVGGAN